jgi:bifunctional non-homologous end joining protein LigD
MRWQERDGPTQADEPATAPSTLVRRTPRREPLAPSGDLPAVRPTAVGGGPRRLPRHARRDWRAEATALAGAAPLQADARFLAKPCVSRTSPPAGNEWLHEIKWDGYRLLVELRKGNARLRSRDGLDWTPRFPEIARALESIDVDQAWLDGEVVALDDRGRSDFNALQRALKARDTGALRLLAFDLPALAGVDLAATPLLARKTLLERLLAAQPSPTLSFSQHLVGNGERVFAASLRQGVEGIVSKRVDSPYSATRRLDWVKVEHADSDEFVVVGHAGRGRGGSGSLLLAQCEDDRLRYAGRVGTGLDPVLLESLARRMRPLRQAAPTLALPSHAALAPSRVQWLRPELVAEVAYRGWDKQGLLRQARFKRLREDRDAGGLEGRARNTEAGMDIRITHPERIVFAATKGHAAVSKGEVADYYRRVARWMLPELARRPLSLLRCPDGASGACFFQKHHSDSFGEAVKAIPLRQKDGIQDYLQVEDAEGLLALVQFNAIEFHPWGSRVDDPERPDRMVFDLDPHEGLAWKAVVAAAREVRARLRERGLESFVRQTGGKGLHVVAPIRPGPDWQALKDFCESVASEMAQQHPDRYVATMSKARREGRLFVDWLRNSRGATSVTSWSLRARPGAPVAMPLRWDELGKLEGAGAFDLARALRRAATLRKDPWDGMATLDQRLPA